MIYIFYHIYCNQSTLSIVRDQINKIIFSGLYKKVDKIYCFISGNDETHIENVKNIISTSGEKFVIADVKPNDTTYERLTLRQIPNYIKNEDNLLYIHSKGVTHANEPDIINFVYDWRNYMEYFLIAKHDDCIALLDSYDTVGVNYKTDPKHYSGNFWWCRGKHYLSLNISYLDSPAYYIPEFFICNNENTKVYNLVESNCNHYKESYPICKYINS